LCDESMIYILYTRGERERKREREKEIKKEKKKERKKERKKESEASVHTTAPTWQNVGNVVTYS
jgi:hypothetical protein